MPEAKANERVVTNGGVRLHCVHMGPSDGPLVLFLHGFPARWSTWRAVMPAFAARGLLAVAPDLRGYGASDRPKGVDSYSIPKIVEDVVVIVRAFDRDKAFVVGHDFGGGVAWATAMIHPELVARLAILNAVHPVGFARQMRKWSQVSKSWYLDPELATPPSDWVSNVRIEHVENASHWVHHDAPARVADLVLSHLAS
jgi:pimeloyl-ACP methyl ester carboxylesterase